MADYEVGDFRDGGGEGAVKGDGVSIEEEGNTNGDCVGGGGGVGCGLFFSGADRRGFIWGGERE